MYPKLKYSVEKILKSYNPQCVLLAKDIYKSGGYVCLKCCESKSPCSALLEMKRICITGYCSHREHEGAK